MVLELLHVVAVHQMWLEAEPGEDEACDGR